MTYRWMKMPEGSRLAVIDRTFDVMVQQTVSNTTGYKMPKPTLFLLCPEIAPEKRKEMSKEPKKFIDVGAPAVLNPLLAACPSLRRGKS